MTSLWDSCENALTTSLMELLSISYMPTTGRKPSRAGKKKKKEKKRKERKK